MRKRSAVLMVMVVGLAALTVLVLSACTSGSDPTPNIPATVGAAVEATIQAEEIAAAIEATVEAQRLAAAP
jgi:hypothetical protein